MIIPEVLKPHAHTEGQMYFRKHDKFGSPGHRSHPQSTVDLFLQRYFLVDLLLFKLNEIQRIYLEFVVKRQYITPKRSLPDSFDVQIYIYIVNSFTEADAALISPL